MPAIDPGRTYEAEVVAVTDGDTVDVEFADGEREECRLIGVDTPETSENSQFERTQEWVGIEALGLLGTAGEAASAFATERLADATVTLSFDPSEPPRDEFGRLLVYLEYDTTLFNRELLAAGRARVYHSGVSKHDEFRAITRDAREAGTGLWADSDPDATPPTRNASVEELFFPGAATVLAADGPLPEERAPVRAEATATPEGRPPLVGIDREARVALVGGLLIDERFETAEGFAVDTAGYGNFPFLTNLVDELADRSGSVLVDGGHGQFGVDYACSLEDIAYYRRYLEGQGIATDQRNRLSTAYLDTGRALLVTPPVGTFGEGELARLRAFRDDGGAIVLLDSAAAPAHARRNLDTVAASLDGDCRTGEPVTDPERNLDANPTVVRTTAFNGDAPLFDAYNDS